ncbi:class I SAM-dependent methyltransferase [Streptomyces sp. 549]|uniref:HemK2/MTQ2 family protein methyltransferase n=1 Tax=Streptomyces sp. 549 TaxID=3049076 RepID=UPI0024C28276|nr:HemK2/MTQ2 family protein methyltransferase [Streptomyces sp. 549]MDK1471952.1 class I SAM-dependent methyltransferase [Streptomyces sp. 549]
MLILKPPGVYATQEDTDLLVESLRNERLGPQSRVLDMGTGTGALAMAAARSGAGRVTATDASARAVLTARLNARLNGLRVRVVRGDLVPPDGADGFDLVLANPPYVPSPGVRLPRRGPARAWDAGPDGRVFIDRICRGATDLLAPGGVLLMVHSALCGAEQTVELLGRAGMAASVTERRFVPFGPVMRSRASWLTERGLIAPGADKEELVVVRARRQD